MTAASAKRAALGLYIGLFFLYLFGPLLVMGISAFNTSSYPTVIPFEGFTWNWFLALANDKDMIYGLQNSLIIGVCVVALAVPVGLAGAIMMQQITPRARGFYYLVVVSPVLTPGVIIGISTVIFWRDLTTTLGSRLLYNGDFLTVLGQSSFISAYCMLICIARLQRFDRALEEAGLDLGASRTQIFWHIMLPFMRPALLSSAVLAFLSSFENYNTTTFAILADKTLTTVLAGRVRQGSTPAISALAVVIIAVTICGALLYEVLKRRDDARKARIARLASKAEAQDLAIA